MALYSGHPRSRKDHYRQMSWELITTTRSHMVRIDEGEPMTFAEAHTAYGQVNTTMVRSRIAQGWEVEKAFTTPVQTQWGMMTTAERKALVQNMVDRGMTPDSMAPLIDGAGIKALAIFCGNHDISYGSRPKKDAALKMQGVRMWGRDIDPKTEPNPNGVHFEETNMHTCKWPLWEWDAKPEERICCGAHTVEGKPYCQEHARR